MGGPPQSETAARADLIRRSPRLLRAAWMAGQLWWLLDSNQLRAYRVIRRLLASKQFARFLLEWARRTGKTWLLLLVVIEECIRHPVGHRYNMAAATKESLAEFVWPAFHAIMESCPDDLKPRVREARGRVRFVAHAKKSKDLATELVLAGCNDARSIERIRGRFSNGNVIEEAGAIPDSPGLAYIMKGVLNPQLMTTGGWTLMAMTPPKSTGSESSTIAAQAEAAGADAYDHCTLYDNPRLSPDTVTAYLESDAAILGMTVEEYKETADYRREWLAIRETDPTLAVIPEATKDRMDGSDGKAPAVVRVMPDVPMFRDRYDAMDLGFHPHFTFLLFGYWDYARQILVVEDELARQRLNDTELAGVVQTKETELWGEHRPFLRVADNNYPMTLAELAVHHGLPFLATAKDELEAAIINVRRWIRQGKLAIHPRCKMLIAQLQAAIWNNHRTEFAEVRGFGHFDGVAALIYLVRNVIPNVSREPDGWGFRRDEMARSERPTQQSEAKRKLKEAFGGY